MANRERPSELSLYARARVAENVGDIAAALKGYRAALAVAPDNGTVAFRTYRRAVDAGDYALAVRAAQTLDRAGALPPDAHLLLYVAAVRTRDWREAERRVLAIGAQPGFAFIAPLLRDWLALETHAPVALPQTKNADRSNAYAAENAALLQIAQGNARDGMLAVRTLWSTDPYRARSLRIAAASTLADRGARDDAVSLLMGDDPSTAIARQRIEKRKALGLSVDTPARGAAFVLARMAGDLVTERSARTGITLAQFAAFADPDNARIALIAAGALAGGDRNDTALMVTDRLLSDPVYGNDAQSLRIDLLEALDRSDEALAEATARAGRSTNDLTRLGDIEARRGNYAAAAGHYATAIAAIGADNVEASLWHARGNALDMAGDWPGARTALERAVKLAPDDAVVLNELGYGLIDRSEDIDRGAALVKKANGLMPDNAAIADSMGWAEFRRGRVSNAIGLLERAIQLANGEPEIAEHLGDAYWTAGWRVDARYSWRAARIAAEGDAIARLDQKIDRGLP